MRRVQEPGPDRVRRQRDHHLAGDVVLHQWALRVPLPGRELRRARPLRERPRRGRARQTVRHPADTVLGEPVHGVLAGLRARVLDVCRDPEAQERVRVAGVRRAEDGPVVGGTAAGTEATDDDPVPLLPLQHDDQRAQHRAADALRRHHAPALLAPGKHEHPVARCPVDGQQPRRGQQRPDVRRRTRDQHHVLGRELTARGRRRGPPTRRRHAADVRAPPFPPPTQAVEETCHARVVGASRRRDEHETGPHPPWPVHGPRSCLPGRVA